METAKSKGKRGIFALAVGIIAVIMAIFLSSVIGHSLVSLNDHSPVLKGDTQTQFIYNATGSGIAFASVNGTTTYDMPFNETVSFVLTNLTQGELNDFSVSNLTILFGYPVTANESLGFGTNVSNFQPILNISLKNESSEYVQLQPQYITGNQSSYLMVRMAGNTTSYSFNVFAYGNSQFSFLGPFAGEQIGYLISGIVIFGAAFVESPWFDIEIMKRDRSTAKVSKKNKKGGK